MKQTVSEQFGKKEWISIAVSEAVCLLNSPLLERSGDLSNKSVKRLLLSIILTALNKWI